MGIVLKKGIKKFNAGTERECMVLKGVDLKIDNGDLLAVKGKSGAGKSTLLHILGCLDDLTSGEYWMDGQDVTTLNHKETAQIRNKKFGYIMQDFGLIHDDTVYSNVSVPLLLGNTPLREIPGKVEESLERIGIYELRNKKAEVLSGGEKQRVAIARALINNPDYILADEPTGALDSTTAETIMTVLIELHRQGKTVVIVTHDQDIANRCEKVVHIQDGICQV